MIEKILLRCLTQSLRGNKGSVHVGYRKNNRWTQTQLGGSRCACVGMNHPGGKLGAGQRWPRVSRRASWRKWSWKESGIYIRDQGEGALERGSQLGIPLALGVINVQMPSSSPRFSFSVGDLDHAWAAGDPGEWRLALCWTLRAGLCAVTHPMCDKG
jgi:hypothetical protein